jgi:hypothetical protein
MPVALRGSLLSHAYAEERLAADFAGRLGEAARSEGRSALRRAWRRARAGVGPASGAAAVADVAVVPILQALGLEVRDIRRRERGFCTARLERAGTVVAALIVTPWAESLDRVRRDAVAHADDTGAPWAIVSDGRALRLIDPARSFARSHLELDVALAVDDDPSFETLWGLMRGEALGPSGEASQSLVHRVLAAAERHAAGIGRSLCAGVLEALSALLQGAVDRIGRGGRGRTSTRPVQLVSSLHEECLTIVYRVLFLLFAEARALVPVWHPIFRDGYSIEALRRLAEDPERPPGLWDTLQAVCRLANHGCHAGDLVVTPFNGRLFAPARTVSADRVGIGDDRVREALVALSTRPDGAAGRRRVGYADLGVEQLGAVYESLLDYRPATVDGADRRRSPGAARRLVSLQTGSGRRKATGSFYTPRSITEYLVRRTLHPLVHERPADAILDLRIVDPAMGSGAFLVAACRYLASAYENALLAEGRCSSRDVDHETRAEFRRLVAQRCLYGVDLNPMAVQLACLSLWLATLAADRPLSFLDHHLRAGDSLIGASPADLARQPPGPRRTLARLRRLPLFESNEIEAMLQETLPARRQFALERDDTADIVRAKERLLAHFGDRTLARWKQLADIWCSVWFWNDSDGGAAPPAQAFPDLTDEVLRGRLMLPRSLSASWRQRAAGIASERRFFHWALEFPEVFYEDDGRPRAGGGFDAVLGNPPWDMLRADGGSAASVRHMVSFVRSAGIYHASAHGHVNLYQLFVERSLGLLRPSGRLGLVVPSGLATDHGGGELRRWLLDRCETDSIIGFDNRAGIFPVHRGLRFLLLTSTTGRPTTTIRCRFGTEDPAMLDRVPDGGDGSSSMFPVRLTRAFIDRFSPGQTVIPHLCSSADLVIAEKIVATAPALDDPAWAIRFSRELNATDDRPHLVRSGHGLPVLEGKHLSPFAVDVAAASSFISRAAAARRVDPERTFLRERLAYRDVASATNALTLIAAIIPRSVLTTHTVFCLVTELEPRLQHYLCGMLNSYVANYLVRLRVTTHVTTAVMAQLRVPRADAGSSHFDAICRLTGRLVTSRGADEQAYASLQGIAARLYGLDRDEFSHILGTFPAVAETRRRAALGAFDKAGPDGSGGWGESGG